MTAFVCIFRAVVRELAQHPWQLALTLLGIAVGVAVVVAIELASESAHRGFVISNDAVMGRTTHVAEGAAHGVPGETLVALRRAAPTVKAAPVVEGVGAVGAVRVTVLGLDPLSEPGFRSYRPAREDQRDGIGPRLIGSNAALLARATANRLQVALGGHFVLRVGPQETSMRLVGYLDRGNAADDTPDASLALGLEQFVVVDIATAQRLLGRGGVFTRIDLIIPPRGEAGSRPQGVGPLDAGLAHQLRLALPAHVQIRPAGARAAARREMTRGFELNLRMLSLLSLVVGLLLIYNAMSFSVARRGRLIATLRALGVTRAEILVTLLAEALALGVVGAGFGLIFGWLLGTQLVALVTQTMSDLYFVSEVRQVTFDPKLAIAGLALGTSGSVIAAALPAWAAAAVRPRIAFVRVIQQPAPHVVVVLGIIGCVGLIAAWGLVAGPSQAARAATSLWLGYLALFCALTGCALLVPAGVVLLVRLAKWCVRGYAAPVLRLALGGVSAELGRVSVAVTAFMVALATTVGVSVMVDSFRYAVESWLEGTLRADLYVAAASQPGNATMADELATAIGQLTDVEHVSRGLWRKLNAAPEKVYPAPRGAGGQVVPAVAAGGEVRVLALVSAPASTAGFDLLGVNNAANVWIQFERGDGVLVSEPFAFRKHLQVGDMVRLQGQSGEFVRPVLAVFRDYRTEAGFVLMARSLYDRHWTDAGYTGLGIYLSPETDTASANARVTSMLATFGRADLDVRTNQVLRERSMAVFDRTFAVTEVLRLLTVLVAFVAVLSALLALEIDRGRERALFRVLGITRAQSLLLVELEGLAQGVLAGVLALPTGLLLSWMLTAVINRRSFGWTMSMQVDVQFVPMTLAIALVAAGLAGLYPAWRVTRAAPGAVLREE